MSQEGYRDGRVRRENPTGEPGDGGVEAEEAVEGGDASTSEIVTDEPPTGHDTFPMPEPETADDE